MFGTPSTETGNNTGTPAGPSPLPIALPQPPTLPIPVPQQPAQPLPVPAATGPSPAGSSAIGSAVREAMEKLGASLVKITGTFGTLADKVLKVIPAFDSLGKLVEKVELPFKEFNKHLEAVGRVSDQLLVPFQGLMDGIQKFVSPLTQFVAALNPALVNLLNLSLRDMSAVIGQAFTPALQEVIAMIQEVAATFQPIMLEFGKGFRDAYDALTDFISIMMDVFKPVLEASAPLYQVLADAIKGLVTALTPVFVLLKALFAFLSPVITTIAQVVSPAIQFLARAATLAGAALLQFFGQTEMVRQMANMIDPEKENERKRLAGFAAVSNVGFTDAQNYGKQMMISAASAGLGMADDKKSSEEWLKQLAEDVRGIGDGNFQAFDRLRKDILDALTALGDKIVKAVGKQAYEAAGTVGSYLDPRQQYMWAGRQLGFFQGGAAGVPPE